VKTLDPDLGLDKLQTIRHIKRGERREERGERREERGERREAEDKDSPCLDYDNLKRI